MSKENLIPEIAKMLGVEVGEGFEVKGYKGLTYQFTDDELIVYDNKNTETEYTTANMTLVSLLKGEREIVKLPWKPKIGDTYWTFYINDVDLLDIDWYIWHKDVDDLARVKAGWAYRTVEDAEEALPKAAEEMGIEYEPTKGESK